MPCPYSQNTDKQHPAVPRGISLDGQTETQIGRWGEAFASAHQMLVVNGLANASPVVITHKLRCPALLDNFR